MPLRSLTGRGNGSLALGVLRVRRLVPYQDVSEDPPSRQWLSGLTVDDLTGKFGRVIPARGEVRCLIWFMHPPSLRARS